MPFIPKNISVSDQSEFFANLTYLNPKTEANQLLSFTIKECYSHFGAKPNSDGKALSIGIAMEDDRLLAHFKKLEARCLKISPTKPPKLGKRLLKALNEKDGRTTLYLKLRKDQLVGVKKGQTCSFEGKITFSAIYPGDKEKDYGPSLVTKVNRATLKPTKKRTAQAHDDEGPSVNDSDDEDESVNDSEDAHANKTYLRRYSCILK